MFQITESDLDTAHIFILLYSVLTESVKQSSIYASITNTKRSCRTILEQLYTQVSTNNTNYSEHRGDQRKSAIPKMSGKAPIPSHGSSGLWGSAWAQLSNSNTSPLSRWVSIYLEQTTLPDKGERRKRGEIGRCPGFQKRLLQGRKAARWRKRENERKGGSKLELLWFTSLHTSKTSSGSIISCSPTSSFGPWSSLFPISYPCLPQFAREVRVKVTTG